MMNKQQKAEDLVFSNKPTNGKTRNNVDATLSYSAENTKEQTASKMLENSVRLNETEGAMLSVEHQTPFKDMESMNSSMRENQLKDKR